MIHRIKSKANTSYLQGELGLSKEGSLNFGEEGFIFYINCLVFWWILGRVATPRPVTYNTRNTERIRLASKSLFQSPKR